MKSRTFFLKVVLLLVLTAVMGGCAREERAFLEGASNGRIQIVCTTFPQYDWVRSLIKGNEEQFELALLMDKGGDLHNFQPSVLDIARISSCDLFIYVGGESDAWVEDAMREAANPNRRVLNMMETVTEHLLEEEHVEGTEEHRHSTEESVHAYDEHVWLSLHNAILLTQAVCEELTELDSDNAARYWQNCAEYTQQIALLDDAFVQAVADGGTHTLLFADRFPFRYFVEDYGLNYYAAFDGCSAETGASFETVAFLAGRLDALGLGAVLVTDGTDDRLAQVVIENTQRRDQKILRLDSMQSVSRRDVDNGMQYLLVMADNLQVLKQALAMPERR